MWVYHVNIKDRKEAINLRRRIVRDSIISDLKENEIINIIVRDRAGKVIVSSQNRFLSGKLSMRITITVIIFFIVIIIIIVIFLTLSRAVADIGSKVLINLIWE